MQLSGSDIRHLEIFDSVVRNRGFAAAEAELGISASTISNHITALEQRIGMKVCQRGRAGFALTQKGQETYELIRQFLRFRREVGEGIDAIKERPPGEIRIGLMDSIATDPNCRLTDAFRLFRSRAPKITFVINQDPPQELQMKVREGDYHCGVGTFPHLVSGLNHVPLYSERHYLYVGRQHPWFDADEASLGHTQLVDYDYVRRGYWRTKDYGPFKFGPAKGVVSRIEPQLILILSGGFVGLLPEHVAAPWEMRSMLRRVLADTVFHTGTYEFISRKGRAPSAPIKAFLECCREAHGAVASAGSRPARHDGVATRTRNVR